MEYFGRDLQFAIDQIGKLDAGEHTFAHRFDLSRIGAIGHSSGFSAVSNACRRDARIKACVNVDAPRFTAELLAGVHQPLLWIRLERGGSVPAPFLRTASAPVYELQINDAKHGSIEDWDYLEASSPKERARAAQRLTLLRNYIAAFLGRVLQGHDSDLLSDFQSQEVTVTCYPAP